LRCRFRIGGLDCEPSHELVGIRIELACAHVLGLAWLIVARLQGLKLHLDQVSKVVLSTFASLPSSPLRVESHLEKSRYDYS